jgi:hypothetical protein
VLRMCECNEIRCQIIHAHPQDRCQKFEFQIVLVVGDLPARWELALKKHPPRPHSICHHSPALRYGGGRVLFRYLPACHVTKEYAAY